MTGVDAAAVRELLQANAAMDDDAPDSFGQDLITKLVESTGAKAGRAQVDRGDGRGFITLATSGPGGLPSLDDLHFPLLACRPWVGEIVLSVPDSVRARTLGMLAADRLGAAMENERLREVDFRRQTWLTFLAECSELLAQSLEMKLTMALVPHLVVPRLGEWCALYLADSSGEFTLSSAAHADETKTVHLLSLLDGEQTGVTAGRWHEVLRTTTPAYLSAPLDGYAVPLIARGLRLGTLVVGRALGQRRDPDEMAIAEDVARRAAVALDNARTHDERRRLALTLQSALLPPTLPEVAGLSLGAEYVPATDGADVGGDFYDVISMPDGRCIVLIGDVSGKGVQAAVITGLVRDVFRVLVRDGRPLPSILSTLNETLFERRERHCTMALAEVKPGALPTQREVSLYLAGHDRPLLVDADGKVSTVGAWGTALGLLNRVSCPEAGITLGPGDTLVFFTDGVTDRRKGEEFFGIERLQQATGELSGYPAEVIAARLRSVVLDFSTERQRDDLAILVLRNEG